MWKRFGLHTTSSLCLIAFVAACTSSSSSPQPTFQLPAADALIAAPFRVGVQGLTVSAASFRLDGVEWARVDVSPFETDLDPTAHPTGPALVEVVAFLDDGAEVTASVQVTIDNVPAAGQSRLTVLSGQGDGVYDVGSVVEIVADPPLARMIFDRWTGDTQAVQDVNMARTSVTLPASDVTVAATYEPVVLGPVTAVVETDMVPTSGDAADDMCVWVHPTDEAKSTVIGTDKAGFFLLVYDLAGKEIQRVSAGKVNNVDIRYNFPFDGGTIALVTACERNADTIACYRVNPATRELEAIGTIATSIQVYGECMYHSAQTGDYYGFVTSKSGEVEQWRISDGGNGKVAGTLVRSFDVGQITEGCVADDELGHLYMGEEDVGIWKYGAEPGDGSTRTQVDTTGGSGHLRADVEGLTIYYASAGKGYLLASKQGSDEFVVYEREDTNAYVMTFDIVAGGGIDGVTGTDGIDVLNVALGDTFPQGLFLAQDDKTPGSRQNFKLVPWELVAHAHTTPLTIDTTSFDPRLVGR